MSLKLWTSQHLNTWLYRDSLSQSLTSHVTWNCNIWIWRKKHGWFCQLLPAFASFCQLRCAFFPFLVLALNSSESMSEKSCGGVRSLSAWQSKTNMSNVFTEIHSFPSCVLRCPEKNWENTIAADVFSSSISGTLICKKLAFKGHIFTETMLVLLCLDFIVWSRSLFSSLPHLVN